MADNINPAPLTSHIENESSSDQTIPINDGFIKLSDGTVILGPSVLKFNLDKRITSLQDPYRVIDIAHIVGDPSNPNNKGRLTLSISPGKKDSHWNRDLKLDLAIIKNNGIQVIVCLLEWSEMRMLNITDYPKIVQEDGFIFYHLPIRDGGIPQQKDIDVLVPILIQHLSAGQNVLVHCRAGLGRAGTICACCLGHFGYEGQTAIDTVRAQRHGAVQTRKQEECVINYCNGLIKSF
jgi:protein-tyrosine phosphatase